MITNRKKDNAGVQGIIKTLLNRPQEEKFVYKTTKNNGDLAKKLSGPC